MSSETCKYVLTCGPNLGTRCNKSVTKDGLCDLCNAREDLLNKLYTEGESQGICEHGDPYNGEKEPCARPKAFRGYCFLCLSRY